MEYRTQRKQLRLPIPRQELPRIQELLAQGHTSALSVLVFQAESRIEKKHTLKKDGRFRPKGERTASRCSEAGALDGDF